ncbi:MAG: NUDIX hydrolase [Anaerolineales bacterium]|nr:NUDIX hydrolase [Anaerolineales bacterium]
MDLDQVNYCPQCGTPLEKAEHFGRIRPVCPGCGWIFFPNPRVAVGVLIEKDNKVLLVRRAVNPEKGRWTFPAGFVDAGEDPVSAGQRECLEETGLQVKITRLIDVIAEQAHARGAHIIIFYQAEILNGQMKPGDDVDAVDFFPREHLPPLAFPSTRWIIEKEN